MAAASATWDLLATSLSQESILILSKLKNQTPNSQVKGKSPADGWDRHAQAPEACRLNADEDTGCPFAPDQAVKLAPWQEPSALL